MTWIGKILMVFVLILGIAAMWFMTTVFVARTNWKSDRDAWQNLYKEADKARVAELNRYKAEKESLEKQLVAEQTNGKGLSAQIATLTGANDKISEDNKRMTAILQGADIKAVELQAINQALTDEVKQTRDRNVVLENERVVLTTARENAMKDRQEFENRARRANNDKQRLEARVESLSGQLAEARASGGSSTATVQNSFTKPAAPLPENIRGAVTSYENGYVSVNIGIDAGLTRGAKLDIYRTTGKGEYLGQIEIERVYPKSAVAKFIPRENRNLRSLRPEQLPKTGDEVGLVGSSSIISR